MIQTPETKPPETCPSQTKTLQLIGEEFAHTQKRLSRQKVIPLVQFCVYVHQCKAHENPDSAHINFASIGSNVPVEGGLQAAIIGVEQLLAALKAKLQ